jgi:transposase InsO family protein
MVWRNRISKKAVADVFAAYKAAIAARMSTADVLRALGIAPGPPGSSARRRAREHDGQVAAISSNCRWCSDALEFTCWNGEVVRLAFALDCHDREVISWLAATSRSR